MSDEHGNETRRDFLKLTAAAGGAALAATKVRPLYAQASGANGGTYDYVVAGGGHNGLVCASYLAMAGFDVAVLEAKPEAGGNTATEHVTGTEKLHEPCCNTPGGLFGSPVYRELDMEGWGVEFAPLSRLDGMIRLSQFYDGEILPMWTDPEQTATEIARFSKRDAQTYLRLMNEDGPSFGEHRRTPIGYGPTIEELAAAHPRGATFLKRRMGRCVDTVKEFYEDEHVQAWVLDYARGRIPTDDPGTGDGVTDMYGRQSRGNNTIIGGTGAIAVALTRLLEKHNAPVLTRKFVVEIIVENGRAAGVVTADGDVYRTRRGVISSAHVQQLLTMCPDSSLPDVFTETLRSWQPDILAMFNVMLDVNEAPLFNVHGDWRPGHGNIINTFDAQLEHLADCRQGRVTRQGVGSKCIVQSIDDPSRVPEGGHVVRILTHYPYELADGGAIKWDEIKHDVARDMIDSWKPYTRNLDDDNITAMYVQSPLDVEGRNVNNVKGSCHGGSSYLAQYGELRPVYGWASHRMPIDGLYLTGAGAHPGGSVNGLAGRNAAWVILDDEGTTIDRVLSRAT